MRYHYLSRRIQLSATERLATCHGEAGYLPRRPATCHGEASYLAGRACYLPGRLLTTGEFRGQLLVTDRPLLVTERPAVCHGDQLLVTERPALCHLDQLLVTEKPASCHGSQLLARERPTACHGELLLRRSCTVNASVHNLQSCKFFDSKCI